MTYPELLARLYSARRFGVVLGLDRMRALLDCLGGLRLGTVVHVGGTNGKGSTVAVLDALVAHARVATYTSPHLSCLRERITIAGEMISEAAIVAAAKQVTAAGGDELTFFEQITAIAAVAIAEAQVDVTILEVGLGGRLDATNAFDGPNRPRIAVVTGVAMDHQAILGETLETIALEKAGIFKRDQRIVIGASGEPAAVPVLVDAARNAKPKKLTVIDDAAIAQVPPLGLAGAHQRANAAAALAAYDELCGTGVIERLPPHTLAGCLARVRHPGRFETIRDAALDDTNLGDVIVDGAHNPHGATALVATLREQGLVGDRAPVLVVAVSADKDVAAIARVLAPAACAMVATRYQQERAMPPEQLAAVFREAGASTVAAAPDLRAALIRARELANAAHPVVYSEPSLPPMIATRNNAVREPPIVVCGSLFVVGEARVLLLDAPADPFVVTDPAPVTSR